MRVFAANVDPMAFALLAKSVIQIRGAVRRRVRAENVLLIMTVRPVRVGIIASREIVLRVYSNRIVRQEVNVTRPPLNA